MDANIIKSIDYTFFVWCSGAVVSILSFFVIISNQSYQIPGTTFIYKTAVVVAAVVAAAAAAAGRGRGEHRSCRAGSTPCPPDVREGSYLPGYLHACAPAGLPVSEPETLRQVVRLSLGAHTIFQNSLYRTPCIKSISALLSEMARCRSLDTLRFARVSADYFVPGVCIMWTYRAPALILIFTAHMKLTPRTADQACQLLSFV